VADCKIERKWWCWFYSRYSRLESLEVLS